MTPIRKQIAELADWHHKMGITLSCAEQRLGNLEELQSNEDVKAVMKSLQNMHKFIIGADKAAGSILEISQKT